VRAFMCVAFVSESVCVTSKCTRATHLSQFYRTCAFRHHVGVVSKGDEVRTVGKGDDPAVQVEVKSRRT